jgi:hypothetical protein
MPWLGRQLPHRTSCVGNNEVYDEAEQNVHRHDSVLGYPSSSRRPVQCCKEIEWRWRRAKRYPLRCCGPFTQKGCWCVSRVGGIVSIGEQAHAFLQSTNSRWDTLCHIDQRRVWLKSLEDVLRQRRGGKLLIMYP